MPNIETLKQMRFPVLDKREKNREGKNDPKVEKACNEELQLLNGAIKGLWDYDKEKASRKKPSAPKQQTKAQRAAKERAEADAAKKVADAAAKVAEEEEKEAQKAEEDVESDPLA